ncbi:MAG: class II aldolase/adducin family protein [Pseudomonadota bacterium]|nr:class II aldolase/adducin family protein [Pseudomonadota bacterium]
MNPHKIVNTQPVPRPFPEFSCTVHAVSGANQVRVAPYATFGSDELARQTVAGLGKDNCILMANHGLLAVGKDIHQTYNIALYIEEVAELYYQTR